MTNQIYDNNGLKKHIVFTLMAKMKMKLKWFLPVLLYLFTGHCQAGVTYTLNDDFMQSELEKMVTFNIDGSTIPNSGGALKIMQEKQLPPPDRGIQYYKRNSWGSRGNGTWRWASTSPLVTASYDNNNVDTTQTRTVDGKTYYKLKMVGDDRFPVYVRFEQKLFLPGKNYTYVDLKDIENQSRQNRGSSFFNITYSNDAPTSCSNIQGNIQVELSCIGALYYKLPQFANRDVKVYFYMPKTPLYPINFNNVYLGSLSFSNVCISETGGDETTAFQTANNCTLNSSRTVVSKFYLNGSLIFRNTCKVTETTKNIVLANITDAKLAGKAQGALPEGYTPKETKVSMKCSGNINNTFPNGAGIVQATMMGAGYSFDADLASKGILLAKGVGTTINNLGVKITQDAAGQSLVKLDGLSPLRATINNDMATVTFYSYPTPARAGVNPTGAGGYEASATLTFEIL
jgi:hypothetical protein